MVFNDLKNLPTPVPEDNGEFIVFVDNGYAQQKIAYWGDVNGEKTEINFLTPSRAQMGRINVDVHGKASGVYNVNGSNYTVGEDVRQPETLRSKHYAHSEINCALVMHSLIVAGFAGKKIRLGTGLPFEHYFKNSEVDEKFLAKVSNSILQPCTAASGIELPQIVSHKVYPESTAAAVSYSLNTKTGELKSFENGLVVIDMGGGTTDITVINADFTINMELSGSRNLGVIDIRTALAALIEKKFDVTGMTDAQLDRALRTKTIKMFGVDEAIDDALEEAQKETVKKLSNFISETVGEAAFIDTILFVGGGAEILAVAFKGTYKQAIVPENAEYANANGALRFMTFVEA